MEWKEILIKSGLAGLAGAIGEFLVSWDLSWTTLKIAITLAVLRGALISIASIQGEMQTTRAKCVNKLTFMSKVKKYL